jgi:hypothetical protein
VIMAKLHRTYGAEFNRIVFSQNGASAFVTNNGAFWTALWREKLAPLGYKMTSINEDEMLQLKSMTQVLEMVRFLKSGRPWPEVAAMLTNYQKELDQKFADDRLNRLLMSRRTIFDAQGAFQTMMHTETQRRLTIAAIASSVMNCNMGSHRQALRH